MEELERFVALSHGLTARVVGFGAGVLTERFSSARQEQSEYCRAVLVLVEDPSMASATADPAFRVDLRWRSPREAVFTVPGGVGTLALSDTGPVQIEAMLRLRPSAGRMAVETTLRLLLSLLLPTVGGLLVHASAVVIDGKAHVFMGHSGAGKTTTAHRLAAEGAHVLAEDLLIAKDGHAEACRFDVAGRAVWDASGGAKYPVAAAYLVHKHAVTSQVTGLASTPLRAWSEAIFSARLPGQLSASFVDVLTSVASGIPMYNFDAAAAGALRLAIESAENR